MGAWSGRGIPPTRRKLHRLRKKRRDEDTALRRQAEAERKRWDRDARRLKVDLVVTEGVSNDTGGTSEAA
jgi:hypothetical protein